MRWLLVVIVMGSPVKTDLVFEDFRTCMAAEETMRKQWTDALNSMIKQKVSQESLNFVSSQSTSGTCIPTR